MSNEKKSKTLGMPHGTATNRLRKMLLFNQLQKHKENICIRCDKNIESVEELSIDHIKPWEGISAELFWDLSNVLFSHARCNRPHTYGGGRGQRFSGPDGTSWCIRCKMFEPIDDFWKNKSHWNGLSKCCKKTNHYYRKKDSSACGETENAEDLKPSAPIELAGANPALRTKL